MAASSDVRVDDDRGVRTITLDRQESLNALGFSNGQALVDALRAADDEEDVRCVVLTGAGRGFCVGADLKEMMSARAAHESGGDSGLRTSRAMAMSPLGVWNRILNVMREFHKPLIAAVNGLAVGGGLLLACAADLRIASEDAEFSALFAKRGLAFEAGTSYYLPRLVGLENAFRMVYTAERYPAAEAQRMGLVGEVVPAARLQQHTHELALRIAEMPTLQLGLARMEILRGMTFDDPNASMMIEMFALGVSQHSHDYEEGHASFIEKREPRFIGR